MDPLRGEESRWERLARNPYWAVLNARENRGAELPLDRLEAFFESGEASIARTVALVERWLEPTFHPRIAVDFGCGVGRLAIPLSRRCDKVIALDIAPTMLAETRANCAARGVTNVETLTPDAFWNDERFGRGAVDFVHSEIVFQHMQVRAGEEGLRRLLRVLRPGGCGALQFTYARRASRARKAVNRLRKFVPGLNAAVNVVQGRPALEPQMPMHQYDLGRLVDILADHGAAAIHARPTNDGGYRGAMLFFRID